jgi:hypothetical protein
MRNLLLLVLTASIISCGQPSDEAKRWHGIKVADPIYVTSTVKSMSDAGDVNEARIKLDSFIKQDEKLLQNPGIKTLSQQLDSTIKIKNAGTVALLMPKVVKEEDDMTGYTRYRHVTSPKYVNQNGIFLTIASDKEGFVSLFLKIQYFADDWLFIQKYIVKADEDVFEIIPSNVNTDNAAGMIWETTTITVNEDLYSKLLKLAQAKSAKVRFDGRQYYKDKAIKSTELQALSHMLELYSAMGGKPLKY